MPNVRINLGDLIMAYFGLPGPSQLKSGAIGQSIVTGALDNALAGAQDATAAKTGEQRQAEAFPDLVSKPTAEAMQQYSPATPNPYFEAQLQKPYGGNETLNDVFSLLRTFTKR